VIAGEADREDNRRRDPHLEVRVELPVVKEDGDEHCEWQIREVALCVKDIFHAHKARYGAPRVSRELVAQGHPADKKTVASSLRGQALVARAGRKFKATTNSKHNLDVAPNLLSKTSAPRTPMKNGPVQRGNVN
jgi:transposase InsO family protein